MKAGRVQVQKKIVVTHFDEIAPWYDEKTAQRLKYLAVIDALIIEVLKEKKEPKILDLGCGTGVRIMNIAKHLNKAEVYGIDIARRMVTEARKRMQHVEQMDMVSLGLAEKDFDAALCLFNCFGYLSTYKERIRALKNINWHLKNDGLLFIDVMNARHTGEGISFRRTTMDILTDSLSGLLNPSLGFGNKIFSLEVNRKKIEGFVHGHYDLEMRWLFWKSGFTIKKRYVIGYDSGEIKNRISEGQLFYICQKKKPCSGDVYAKN